MNYKAKSRGKTVSVQMMVEMEDWLVEDRTPQELTSDINKGLMLVEYINGKLSIGEISEHTGKSIDETMQWLNNSGVSTLRLMSPEMEAIAEKNMLAQMEALGISSETKK